MAATKKNIIDSIKIIATRFQPTDESRIDDDWISYKIDQVRAELITKQYLATGIIDYTWLSDGSLLPFYVVNRADNPTITCDCDISKASIPQTLSLIDKDGNLDFGIYSLISPCGKTTYYPKRMSQWRFTPIEHTNSLFGSYARVNTELYVDRVVQNLKLTAILLHPEDGYVINSTPVLSGSIVSGIIYFVKLGQIIYNNTVYAAGSTFTGGSPTTFVGSGTVYLNSQVTSYLDTSPYPASGDMIRAIEFEILTKEFGIEKTFIADVRNDSKDDASQSAQ